MAFPYAFQGSWKPISSPRISEYDTVCITGIPPTINLEEIRRFFSANEGPCSCIYIQGSFYKAVAVQFYMPGVAQRVAIRYNNAFFPGFSIQVFPLPRNIAPLTNLVKQPQSATCIQTTTYFKQPCPPLQVPTHQSRGYQKQDTIAPKKKTGDSRLNGAKKKVPRDEVTLTERNGHSEKKIKIESNNIIRVLYKNNSEDDRYESQRKKSATKKSDEVELNCELHKIFEKDCPIVTEANPTQGENVTKEYSSKGTKSPIFGERKTPSPKRKSFQRIEKHLSRSASNYVEKDWTDKKSKEAKEIGVPCENRKLKNHRTEFQGRTKKNYLESPETEQIIKRVTEIDEKSDKPSRNDGFVKKEPKENIFIEDNVENDTTNFENKDEGISRKNDVKVRGLRERKNGIEGDVSAVTKFDVKELQEILEQTKVNEDESHSKIKAAKKEAMLSCESGSSLGEDVDKNVERTMPEIKPKKKKCRKKIPKNRRKKILRRQAMYSANKDITSVELITEKINRNKQKFKSLLASKKKEIEKEYNIECSNLLGVVTKLASKDPNMTEKLKEVVRETLMELENHLVKKLETSMQKWFPVCSVEN